MTGIEDVHTDNEQLIALNPELARLTGKQVATSKYRAVRTEYEGHNYPSKKQAEDAAKLHALVGKGKPYKLCLEEVKIRLPKGESHRVDFLMITWEDKAEWLESKGKDLEAGRLRRHMCEEFYNIQIKII